MLSLTASVDIDDGLSVTLEPPCPFHRRVAPVCSGKMGLRDPAMAAWWSAKVPVFRAKHRYRKLHCQDPVLGDGGIKRGE